MLERGREGLQSQLSFSLTWKKLDIVLSIALYILCRAIGTTTMEQDSPEGLHVSVGGRPVLFAHLFDSPSVA